MKRYNEKKKIRTNEIKAQAKKRVRTYKKGNKGNSKV